MKRNDKRVGLQEFVDGLLFSLQAEGKAARTIEYYRDLLQPFIDYAWSKGWVNGDSSLDAHRLREFLSWVGSRTPHCWQRHHAEEKGGIPYFPAIASGTSSKVSGLILSILNLR